MVHNKRKPPDFVIL